MRKMELCSCGRGGYQNFHFCCFMYVVSNNYLIKIRAIKRLNILLDRLHKLGSYYVNEHLQVVCRDEDM